MKRLLAITAVATLMSIGIAPAAQAGEITGKGKPTPVNDYVAASICSFSGLDDVDELEDPNNPLTDDFGRTQNLGQIVKTVPSGFRAGINASGCNPHAEHEG